VDSLVFVSRHLSERNLDKYEIFTLCCINWKKYENVDSDSYWFLDYSTAVL
jgi:hypothetical protein